MTSPITKRLKTLHDERYQAIILALSEARKTAGISQIELAEKMGLNQSDISKIECFQRRLDVIELADWIRLTAGSSLALQKELWGKINALIS